jgi:hypothetical protein
MDDETLLHQFETQTFPYEEWRHRVHVKVAYLYLTRYGLDDALNKIRSGIKAYNAAKCVPESLTTGYHETMTQAWIRLIDFTIRQHGPAENADAFADVHPELLEQKVLRFFYSRERFTSPEAKRTFLEPDLAPLPIPGNSRPAGTKAALIPK